MKLYTDDDVQMVIKYWIDSRGDLSHREIAHMACLSEYTLCRIYNGERKAGIKATELLNIAIALGQIPPKKSSKEG